MIIPGSANPVMWGSPDPIDELGVISRALRCRSGVPGYLTRTPSIAGNRKTWTFNAWIKRTRLAPGGSLLCSNNGSNQAYSNLTFDGNDKIYYLEGTTIPSNPLLTTSNAQYRDVSSHINVHVMFDTTNATASQRFRVFINGAEIVMNNAATLALNYDSNINNTQLHALCANPIVGGSYLDCILSNVSLVDGQALTPSSFGQFHPRTGQWRPKSKAAIRAAVAAGGGARNGWGANGFFLPFDDATSLTTLGYDRSQSDTDTTGNNWTANNFSLTPGPTYDSMLDTPTDNFCTFNPLVPAVSGTVFKNGNLTIGGVHGIFSRVVSTQPVSAGVVIWEAQTAGNVGIVKLPLLSMTSNGSFGSGANEYAYRSDGQKNLNGTTSAYGASFSSADVITGVLDLNAGTLTFYKNGVSQGIAFSGLSGEFLVGMDQGSAGGDGHINFGQRPFSHPVAGAKAICTKNLPIKPPVMKSTDAFVAKTNSGANIVADLSAASPWSDWIRIYKRRDAAEGWRWQFSDDAGNFIDSSSTAAKAAFPALTGASYVGYSLKVSAANGVATGRLTHTNGVADTVADGLANSRKAIILKNEGTGNWFFYHPDLTAGKLLYLNSTAAETTDASISNVTASGFTVASALASGMYRWIVFAELEGFLKLWKHTGNGSVDGPLIGHGMRPMMWMIKNITTGGTGFDFVVADAARETSNPETQEVRANLADAEVNGGQVYDFVANGLKLRGAGAKVNASGGSHVGIAFAAFPFRYANAR